MQRNSDLDQHYKTISPQQAKSNSKYWQLVENMFREQSARIIQRKWRQEHKKEYKGKYNETLTGSLTLRFIKEPWGLKAKAYAEMINKGYWTKLDFQDAEFVRHIYKALRQDSITTNQMVTALLLHDAQKLFPDEKESTIKQYHFEDKRAYNLSSICYISRENIQQFYANLLKLPESERHYFAINFSRKFEIAFLYDGLFRYREFHKKTYCLYPKFISFLSAYIQKQSLAESAKTKLVDCVSKLNRKETWKEAQTELIAFIESQEKDLIDYLRNGEIRTKDRDFSVFLISLLRVNEQIPCLEISQDYDLSRAASPLISMILPTMSAFIELQKVIHGKDTTSPFFTAGQFTPRLIREADEYPQKFGMECQSRPVELTHPDLKSNVMPHTVAAHNFILTWHDLFHCWRNGANTIKPFIRYVRKIFSEEKSFEMSKSIWLLTDMDISIGRKCRMEMIYFGKWLNKEIGFFHLLENLSDQFWKKIDAHDDNLILIIDMIKNAEKWKNMLGTDPEIFFKHKVFNSDEKSTTEFSSVFAEMKKIMKDDIKKNNIKSNMVYILTYRLRNHSEGLDLCKSLQGSIVLKRYMHWDRNKGLYFNSKLLSDYKTQDLYQALLNISPSLPKKMVVSENKYFGLWKENKLSIVRECANSKLYLLMLSASLLIIFTLLLIRESKTETFKPNLM